MLERKRRARINRCLDELKELMSSALASEGENLTKLEKADVLELTVRHLHKLRERQALGLSSSSPSPNTTQDKFRAGFTHCAAEVSRYLATSTGLDVTVGQRLLSHLGRCVHQLETFPATTTSSIPSASYTPPSSPTQQQDGLVHRSSVLPPLPVSPALSDMMDTSAIPCDYSKYSIRSDLYSPSIVVPAEKVWRPWWKIVLLFLWYEMWGAFVIIICTKKIVVFLSPPSVVFPNKKDFLDKNHSLSEFIWGWCENHRVVANCGGGGQTISRSEKEPTSCVLHLFPKAMGKDARCQVSARSLSVISSFLKKFWISFFFLPRKSNWGQPEICEKDKRLRAAEKVCYNRDAAAEDPVGSAQVALLTRAILLFQHRKIIIIKKEREIYIITGPKGIRK